MPTASASETSARKRGGGKGRSKKKNGGQDKDAPSAPQFVDKKVIRAFIEEAKKVEPALEE